MSAGPGCEYVANLLMNQFLLNTFAQLISNTDFDGPTIDKLYLVGAIKKRKVYVPVREHPDVNFLGAFTALSR